MKPGSVWQHVENKDVLPCHVEALPSLPFEEEAGSFLSCPVALGMFE